MINLQRLFFILLPFIVTCNSSRQEGIIQSNFQIDGRSREYILYRPTGLPDNAPLVFVCHGFTDNATNMMNHTKMNAVADQNKFAVCYPQGTKDSKGNTYWEVGYDFSRGLHVNDVKFLTTLASHLQKTYKLSKENTFATGMSNGAEMCMVLACKAPHVFKAIAPVCGCFMKTFFDSIQISKPVPVFMVNSTADQTTSWEGDMENKQGWGAYLPVLTSFNFFVQQNACTSVSIDTLPDLDKEDNSFVVTEKHTHGVNENQVWLYSVVNGDHDWPGASGNMDFHASEEVWEFFRLFLRK